MVFVGNKKLMRIEKHWL